MPVRLNALTSLRFIAAAAVVAHHAPVAYDLPMIERLHLGEPAVSFFFVLSGFVLGNAYADRALRTSTFVGLRAARLFPLHVAALLLMFTLPAGYRTFAGSGWFDPAPQFLANALLLQSSVPFYGYYFAWNAVSWSISTEWYFAIAFPLLVANLQATWAPKLIACVALAATFYLIAGVLHLPPVADYNQLSIASVTYATPLTRLVEFNAGMLTWLAWKVWGSTFAKKTFVWASWIELVAILLVVIALTSRPDPSTSAGVRSAVIAAVRTQGSLIAFVPLLFVMANEKGWISRVISWRPLVFLGDLSFGIYLVHYTALKWVAAYFTGWPAMVTIPGVLAAILVLSTIGHYGIELPFQRFSKDALLGGQLKRRPPD